MAPVTMNKGTAEFLSSEANGYRSRETVTVTVTSTDVSDFPNGIPVGLVLGQITSTGKYVRCNPGVSPSDGSEDASAVLFEELPAVAADYEIVAVVRDAEVVSSKLTYSDTSPDNSADEAAELATVGIITR